MVSKCANPACSEKFLYLHQGKIFQLTPTREVEAVGGGFTPSLYERFWLCDKCCKEMTLVWGGTEARLVPLTAESVAPSVSFPMNVGETNVPRKRSASAGLHRR
jgi:hypothetical protein